MSGYMRDSRGRRLDNFNPARDLDGMTNWWDASKLAGAAGSAISRLIDLCDHGSDLVQYTAANQPTVGAINGLPSVHFSAASRWLAQVTGAQPWYYEGEESAVRVQPLTIFVALKASSAIAASRACIISGNGFGTVGGSAGLAIDGVTSKTYYCDSGLNNTNSGSTPIGSTIGGPSICDDATHILVGQIDSPNAARILDGWLLSVTASLTVADGMSGISIGNLVGSDAAHQFLGDIGEILICSGTLLSAKKIADAVAYLGAKWGVASLGSAVLPAPFEETTTSPDGTAVRIFTP